MKDFVFKKRKYPGKKNRSRRLEKKLSVGAFEEKMLHIKISFAEDVTEDMKYSLADQLIEDVLEPNLMLGAGCLYEEFFVIRDGHGSVDKEDFELIKEWSRHQNSIKSCELLFISDAFYPDRK